MYRDYYGFTRLPFQLTPDPTCYFESLSQRQAATCLNHGLARGEGFVVLTGQIGAGKTTLVAQIMALIDRGRVTTAHLAADRLFGDLADEQPNCGQIVPAIAHAFAVSADPIAGLDADTRKPFLLDSFLGFLRDEARAGRRCLLVVDNAQALPIAALDALRLVADFQLGDRPLLQILLVGQPEFRTRLQCHPDLEQLRQRVIAAHHIEPLAEDEVERYVHHRLSCVGWAGNPGFAPEIATEMANVTGGLPRRINHIVDQLLRLGAAQQRTDIDGTLLTRVLAEWPGYAPGEDETGASAASDLKTRLEVALARSESQIAELRRAMMQFAETRDRQATAVHSQQDDVVLEERLSSLESRVFEQEGTIRHTLTMLIDWIERDEAHSVAA